MQEIETKVLEINKEEVIKKIISLGGMQTQDIRLFVDWYSLPGIEGNNHPWYLRVRRTSDGRSEVSFKSLPTIVGNTRQSKEINVDVSDDKKAKELLDAIGLICYAHQEKDRTSFVLKEWNFDVDTYPAMPAYLEIEGTSEEHIKEAILLLDLESHLSISEGERKLIEEKYGLNWSNMYFT